MYYKILFLLKIGAGLDKQTVVGCDLWIKKKENQEFLKTK